MPTRPHPGRRIAERRKQSIPIAIERRLGIESRKKERRGWQENYKSEMRGNALNPFWVRHYEYTDDAGRIRSGEVTREHEILEKRPPAPRKKDAKKRQD